MRCPSEDCLGLESHIRWTRPLKDLSAVRRGHECLTCGHRFTSVEVPERARQGFQLALVTSIMHSIKPP